MDPQADDDFVIKRDQDIFDEWQYTAYLTRGQVDGGRLLGDEDPYLRRGQIERVKYWQNSDGEDTVSGALPLVTPLGVGSVRNIAFDGEPAENRVKILVQFNLKNPVWLYRDLGLLNVDQGNPVVQNFDLERELRADVPVIAYRLVEMLATMHGTYVNYADIGVYGAIRKHGRLAQSVFLDRFDSTVYVNLYNWDKNMSPVQDVYDVSNLITALTPELDLNNEAVGFESGSDSDDDGRVDEEDPAARIIRDFSRIIGEVADQGQELLTLADMVAAYPDRLDGDETVEQLAERQAPLRVAIEDKRLEILRAIESAAEDMVFWRRRYERGFDD